MPTDYGNADCIEKFLATCASNAIHLIVAGDFSCHYGSHTHYNGPLVDFIADNNLIISDHDRLADVFTFCSEACGYCTWIDHFYRAAAMQARYCDERICPPVHLSVCQTRVLLQNEST